MTNSESTSRIDEKSKANVASTEAEIAARIKGASTQQEINAILASIPQSALAAGISLENLKSIGVESLGNAMRKEAREIESNGIADALNQAGSTIKSVASQAFGGSAGTQTVKQDGKDVQLVSKSVDLSGAFSGLAGAAGAAIGASIGVPALGEAFSFLGDIAGGLAESLGSFDSVFLLLGDVFTRLGAALSPLFDVLATRIGSLLQVLVPVIAIVDLVIQALTPLIAAFDPLVSAVVTLVNAILFPLFSILEPIVFVFKLVGEVLGTLFKAVGPLIEILGPLLVPQLYILAGILEIISPAFSLLSVGAAALSVGFAFVEVIARTAIIGLLKGVDKFLEAIAKVPGIPDSLGKVLNDTIKKQSNSLDKAKDNLSDAKNNLATAVDSVGKAFDGNDPTETTKNLDSLGSVVAETDKSFQQLNEQLTNVPTGVKINERRFLASQSADTGNAGNGVFQQVAAAAIAAQQNAAFVISNLTVVASDPISFALDLDKKAKKAQQDRGILPRVG